MTSNLQIASNRDNARKSTRPRTPEGKAQVARNGVTHGLTGGFQLLDGESPAILDNLLAQLTVEYRHNGETESFLVRQLAELQLRLDRASALESELMSAVVDPHSPAIAPNAILARSLLKDCTFDVALLRLNRYENSLRRSHLASLRELRQQQKIRLGQAPIIRQPSIAEVMEDLARELTKNPPGMPASATPPLFDKANPVPSAAPTPAAGIDLIR